VTGTGRVEAVHLSRGHDFSKLQVPEIRLLAGLGVDGDAHMGVTVRHRSRAARDPSAPNLRQVHLLQAELFEELARQGFVVRPGDLGENVTTRGIDLLALPGGARLRLGPDAVVAVTGLRNPCVQIDRFQQGLMHAVLGRAGSGGVVRKAGVMAVVIAGGDIRAGDAIAVDLPEGPSQPLQPV
jgi:MOSC domain-containing protein YiiM